MLRHIVLLAVVSLTSTQEGNIVLPAGGEGTGSLYYTTGLATNRFTTVTLVPSTTTVVTTYSSLWNTIGTPTSTTTKTTGATAAYTGTTQIVSPEAVVVESTGIFNSEGIIYTHAYTSCGLTTSYAPTLVTETYRTGSATTTYTAATGVATYRVCAGPEAYPTVIPIGKYHWNGGLSTDAKIGIGIGIVLLVLVAILAYELWAYKTKSHWWKSRKVQSKFASQRDLDRDAERNNHGGVELIQGDHFDQRHAVQGEEVLSQPPPAYMPGDGVERRG